MIPHSYHIQEKEDSEQLPLCRSGKDQLIKGDVYGVVFNDEKG